MKLEHYLLTEGRTKKLSEEDFYKGVRAQCSDILSTYKNREFYFRGIDSFSDKFGFINPKNFERTSRNTDNYYTLLMDNLPSWKAYPKRSKSIVFSNDVEMGSSYGNTYILFPTNGAKIGKAPDQDIWYSFPAVEKFFGKRTFILSDFNDFLNKKMSNQPTTFRDLKLNMENIEWKDSGKSLWEVFEPLFDPKRNGFKIITSKSPIPDRISELWTDADCYVMSYWKHEEKFPNLYKDKPVIKKRPKSILDVIEER